jgi:hypothetical protein
MSYVLADFGQNEKALLDAGRRLRELGHKKVDAYSPYPIHGVDEALGLKKSIVPRIALVGGLGGALTGYLMQYWMNGIDFALNVGNRLPHSPPTNIPITFELGVLCASLTIMLGTFALCGFPRTHHPVFEVENFRTASLDAIWLSAEVDKKDVDAVMSELQKLGAREVSRVPEDIR